MCITELGSLVEMMAVDAPIRLAGIQKRRIQLGFRSAVLTDIVFRKLNWHVGHHSPLGLDNEAIKYSGNGQHQHIQHRQK